MIDFWLRPDDFGGVACTLVDGETTATVSANKPADAIADLLDAVERVNREGVAECFWQRSSGLFRWVLRKQDEGRARVILLWSSGTMTGWENVFWSEAEWGQAEQSLLDAVARYYETVP
jgi:hypothetical protein